MVSRTLLYHIHKCLNEIFSPLQDVPFGEKSVNVCADVYRLLPFQGKSVFMFEQTDTSEGRKFKLRKLTEMRQKDDLVFISFLNKVSISTNDDGIDDT